MKKIKLFTLLAAMSISVATQAMQIFVNVPGQSQETLEVEPDYTFATVKTQIEVQTGIAINRQSLFFCGRLVLDTETLQDRSVQKESTLNLVVAEHVYTSFDENDVILFGDKLNLSESAYFNSREFDAAYNPYTLVRGNIVGDDHWDWTVTEAADGAYYIFKDANGALYSTNTKMAVSSSTDGVVVGVSYCFEECYYQLAPHERVYEFADNVDGIEAGLAALVGQTVNTNITRTFYKDGYFNTLCLPFSLDADAIAADYYWGYQSEIFEFESAEMNGGTLDLYLNQVYAIEAGKPYLIRWAEDTWTPTMSGLYFGGVTITASEGQAVGTGVQFVGTIGQTQLENGNTNYLFLGRNNTLYWPNTDNKMKGFRAYFKVSGSVAPHGAPARMIIRKSPTAVENVQGTEINAKKVIRDGQLIIIRNGVEYNANGQAIK